MKPSFQIYIYQLDNDYKKYTTISLETFNTVKHGFLAKNSDNLFCHQYKPNIAIE